MNPAQPGEESKPVKIAQDLTSEEESLLLQTLTEYRDVFAWIYKDLKTQKSVNIHSLWNLKQNQLNSAIHIQWNLCKQDQGGDRQTHRGQLHLWDRTYRMGVTNCGSPQKEWQIESMHQSQKGERSNNQGQLSLTHNITPVGKSSKKRGLQLPWWVLWIQPSVHTSKGPTQNSLCYGVWHLCLSSHAIWFD